ncbi:MAG: hypothetical protein EP332_04970 [Bacteroidetes bacterium]|nr:MAG: hypothetical protein EP332_04970 [Bacteroidota bacterium]
MRALSLFLSFLFHPLLLVSFGALFIFLTHPVYQLALNTVQLIYYTSIIFIGTFILPSSAIYFSRVRGRIENLYMDKPEDRRIPLLIAAIFVLIVFYLFNYKIGDRLPFLIKGYLLGTTTSIVIAALINQWYKISLHGIGLGGIMALLIASSPVVESDIRYWVLAWVLISGLVGTARVFLGSHKPIQVYLGYLTGFLAIYIILQA